MMEIVSIKVLSIKYKDEPGIFGLCVMRHLKRFVFCFNNKIVQF